MNAEQKLSGSHWMDVLPTIYKNLENEKLVPKSDLAERVLPKTFRVIKGMKPTSILCRVIYISINLPLFIILLLSA